MPWTVSEEEEEPGKQRLDGTTDLYRGDVVMLVIPQAIGAQLPILVFGVWVQAGKGQQTRREGLGGLTLFRPSPSPSPTLIYDAISQCVVIPLLERPGMICLRLRAADLGPCLVVL